MKRLIKRITTVFVALMIMFCSIPTYANEISNLDISSKTIKLINNALTYVEEDKSSFGIRDVNFDLLEVTDSVNMYSFENDCFRKIGEFYPIVLGSHIIALAISNPQGKYSIETSLAKSIDKFNHDDIAVIYDALGAYLYNGQDLIFLGESGIKVPERSSINENRIIDFSGVKLSSTEISVSLDYKTKGRPTNRQTYYSCNVSYVPQAPYSNLCWAATTACIKNYLNNSNYTTAQIAMLYFNSGTVYNVGMYDCNVASFMQNTLMLSYTYGNYKPSDAAILSNITNGFPIYGSFTWSSGSSNGRHASTIYGVNAVSGYITVMDPEFGSSTATTNGSTYTYVSGYSGVTLTLDRGICHSW